MQEIEQMHKYVDNLVKQKNYLAKALNYQGIEATSTSSLSDLVSATSACEGSKGKAPYIKFTNCKNITQADVDQINVADYEDLSNMFNGGKAGLNLSSWSTLKCKYLNSPFAAGTYTLGEMWDLSNLESLQAPFNNFPTLSISKMPAVRCPKLKVVTNLSQRGVNAGHANFVKKILWAKPETLNTIFHHWEGGVNYPVKMTDPLFDHIFNNWDLTGLKNVNNLFAEVTINQETFDYALSKMTGEYIEYMRDFVRWDTSSSSNGSALTLDLSKWHFKNLKLNSSYASDWGFSWAWKNTPEMHLGTCTSPYFTKLPNSSFHYSRTLTKLDMSEWDFSNVTSIYNFRFYYTDNTLLTDVYAFKNYGKASAFNNYANDSNKTISCYSPLKNISKESLLFLLNGVYDLNITCKVYDEEGNPGTGKLKTQKISLSSAQKAMLTSEEIAIATSKGWTIV